MPPHYKRNRPNGSSQRGRGGPRQHRGKRREPISDFSASRARDIEEDGEKSFEHAHDIDDQIVSAGEDFNSSSEDEQSTTAQSYANLLQALKPVRTGEDRPAKRQKLGNDRILLASKAIQVGNAPLNGIAQNEKDDAGAAELAEDDLNEDISNDEADSDDEDLMLHDPFEQHYANVVEAELNAVVEEQAGKGSSQKTTVNGTTRKITTTYSSSTKQTRKYKNISDLPLKRRLLGTGAAVISGIRAPEEDDVMSEMFNYRDIVCGFRSHENAPQFRDLASLHALNHIFKTRDRVLKNNAKLAHESGGDAEYRDQGFTRPKILVIVPTKQACVRFVESIVKLSEPDQQENKGRFLDHFSQSGDQAFENKPGDFQELFGGNHEEDFRAGLKFTRKTIKFFSGFYNSDIIFASPLGLMRTITTGGGKKEDKKGYDADFLSSIEIAIMDHTNALEMQNWQHVEYVFSQLNLLPKESHGCDFARARNWYLDGKAKYLRQTIIFSDYLTPSISSLVSTQLHNITGRVKYTPTYTGAMLNLSASIPITVAQTFLRFDSPSPQTDSDTRFKFFTTTILPNLLRASNKSSSKGTLIYVPTYLDFVRLRNHFSTSQETTSLSFGTISEYSSRGDVARSRSHFLNGRHSLLLYSERAHHYFRYKLKGVRRVIFYGVPENPLFWGEIIDALGINAERDSDWRESLNGKQGKGLVRAMFSRWDVMKLERIVGTERVARLIREGEGDVFEFV